MASAPAPKPRQVVKAPRIGEEDVVAVRNPRRDGVVGGPQQYPAIMAALERLRQNPPPADRQPVSGSSRHKKTKKSKRSVRKTRASKKRRM